MTISPWMLDAILLVILAEGTAGTLWLYRSGRDALVAGFLAFLASGAALMLGLRLALDGAAGLPLAAVLLASLALHLLAIAAILRAFAR